MDAWDVLLAGGGVPLGEMSTSSLWCQRYAEDRSQRWHRAHPGQERFDDTGLEVRRIDRPTAEGFVVGRHYSGSHVVCQYSFGLFRVGVLMGVASYCVTTEQALTHAFPELTPGVESFELGRFVVADPEPANTETWFDARCQEYLYGAGVAAVLSFADPVPRTDAEGRLTFPGHVGQIYQAGGYKQAGRSTARTLWRLPDGTVLNGITLQKIRDQAAGHESAEHLLVGFGAAPMQAGQRPHAWLRQVRDDPAVGIVLVRHLGCHRYVRPLGRTDRERNQVRVNPRLRSDWAQLDRAHREVAQRPGAQHRVLRLPGVPYPKAVDTPRVRRPSGQRHERATHEANRTNDGGMT
jgi:hypothetical protein